MGKCCYSENMAGCKAGYMLLNGISGLVIDA